VYDAPRVSVIVPAFNASSTIGDGLSALLAQDAPWPYEVIVVDDGSDDGTAAVVEAAGGGVRLLKQEHLGPAEARNRGARSARGSALAFTDSDCVPEPDWLRQGVAALDRADLVQGRVLPDPAATRTAFDRTITIRREYGLYEAANLFVAGALFESLGGFEDWLPARVGKPLAEDVWFGWRARRGGARTAFCDEALVHHAVFDRGAAEYVAERLRLAYFPAMVGRIPELRDAFLYRRWFLTRRTAAFDLAIAAGAVAVLGRRGRRRALTTALAALAAVPYGRQLHGEARRCGRVEARLLAADLAADLTGLSALAAGSARWRAPVL
jgi:glycosyltransferase involved in cell wall biosynthesis